MVSPSSALLLVYTVVAAVGPLIVVPARADLVDSNHSSLVGCDNPPPVKAGHGYRDGRCGGCECCPMRWSCLEMHSRGYSCPERIGVPVEGLAMSLTPATWTVGDVIEASVSGLRWRSLPQCHSVLPPGLQLELNTTDDSTSEPALLFLRGVLGYDPSRPDTYSWDLEIDGVVGNSNTEQYDVQRVRGTVVTIINAVHKRVQWIQAQEDLLVSNDAKARAAGVAGFRAFEQYYNEHTLSHEHAVRRMYSSEQELVSVLDETPAVSAGIFWNWAGGLYMNLHKLLEDVLVSGCEQHFEQGLLYSPDDEILRSNLDGCFAKRLLESAKFMWLAALQLLANTEASTEDLTECRQLLKAATTVKEGWGWGVNNGDIHLSLASVNLRLWADSLVIAEEQSLPAVHGGSDSMRKELLSEAEQAIALCKSRSGNKGPAAGWLREVELLLDAARQARGDVHAELGALAAVDDDMVTSTSGGARVWRERTAAYATTVARDSAPRPPAIMPTPAGNRPARGSECTE